MGIDARAFSEAFCNGVPLPQEVRRCVGAVGAPSPVGDFLAEHDVLFLDPSAPHVLVTLAYLNEEDRRNADIMANADATRSLYGRIAWLFVNDENVLFGYWLDRSTRWPMSAEAVSYDTEGTFESWGRIPLGDLVAFAASFGSADDYARVAKAARRVGLPVSHDELDALYAAAENSELDIAALHLKAYNTARTQRGLKPIKS